MIFCGGGESFLLGWRLSIFEYCGFFKGRNESCTQAKNLLEYGCFPYLSREKLELRENKSFV